MSLQALTELSKIKTISEEGMALLQAARKRHAEYDAKIEKQVQNKHVGHELLMKTCSI
jgi:hypothetical protein